MAKLTKQKLRPSSKDYSVLLEPIVTEKTSLVGGEGSTVVFRVAKEAAKPEIKKAVERVFEVEVAAVRTCNYLGKKKRVNRSIGKQAGFRKAYVTLKEGHSIDIVEGL